MKKEYKDLEMETVRFEDKDVITASGGCNPVDICFDLTICHCNLEKK